MRRCITMMVAALALIGGAWLSFSAAFAQQDGPPPMQLGDDNGPPPFGPPPGFAGQGQRFGGPPRMDAGVVSFLLPPGLDVASPMGMDSLSLTHAQRSKVRDILSDSRADAKSLHEALNDLRDKTASLTRMSQFDETKARKLAEKQVSAIEKLDVIARKARDQIYGSVLNDAQRDKIGTARDGRDAAFRRPAPPVSFELDRMARQIGLNDNQKSKLAAILADRDTARKSAADSLKPIWAGYSDAQSSGFDAGALQAALDKSRPILVNAIVADLKSQSAIWALLSPDQQKTMKSMPTDMPGPGGPGGPGRFAGASRRPVFRSGNDQDASPADTGDPDDAMPGPPPDDGGGDPGGPPPDMGGGPGGGPDGGGPDGGGPDGGGGPGGPPPDDGGPQ